MSSLGISHVDIHSDSPATGVTNSVAEMFTLAATDFKVITLSSGFGKLASWITSKPNATIPIFPQFNENVNGNLQPGSWQPDCATLENYDEIQEKLTSEW